MTPSYSARDLNDIARVFRQKLFPQIAKKPDDFLHPGNRQVGEVFCASGRVLRQEFGRFPVDLRLV